MQSNTSSDRLAIKKILRRGWYPEERPSAKHDLHSLGPMAHFSFVNVENLFVCFNGRNLCWPSLTEDKTQRMYTKLQIFGTISFFAMNATLQKFHETNGLYGNSGPRGAVGSQ
jgi:hypothetical protein